MLARLAAAVAVGVVGVLVAGGVGTVLARTAAVPVVFAVAALSIGLIVAVALYGRRRARGTATGYW